MSAKGRFRTFTNVCLRPVAVIGRIEYLEPISRFPMSAFA